MSGSRRRPGKGWLAVPLAAVLAFSLAPVAAAAPVLPAAPSRHEVGQWQVENLAGGTWQVSWRSPERLPVTSDRPTIVADGEPLGTSVVAEDGLTVTTVVSGPTAPDPSGLDVVLSGDRLDVSGRDSVAPATVSDGPTAGEVLDVDPAEPGPYNVVTSDYEGDPVPVDGFEHPVEFVGHVVEPAPGADTGPRPLVLFLHGRHSYCYDPDDEAAWSDWPCSNGSIDIPSQLGYDYVQQILASQGYATVSIRVNGINAQDDALADGGADARAQLVRAHLDYWAERAQQHQLDLSKVVLVGHSRGGEGVARAALQIPLDAPYRIVGQVLLAPTDFSGQTVPYVPTVTVLPYCDGDVSDLEGQFFTDAARDLVDDDTALHSSVLVMGANHNYFNSEWTPGDSAAPSWDDWWGDDDAACGSADPDRLTPREQRSVGLAYVAGAVELFTGTSTATLPLFDGSAARVASTGSAVVLSHAVGGGRDVRRPDLDAGLTDGTALAQFCVGRDQDDGPRQVCGRGSNGWSATPHWTYKGAVFPVRKALELAWDEPGQTGGLLLDDPLDLSGKRLELRTIVDSAYSDVELAVRLTDADGHAADLVPTGGSTVSALPSGTDLSRLWAQTVVVDPVGSGLDLSRITAVELVGLSEEGRVWVLDVAGVGDGLPAVPAKRIPLVSLGEVSVTEGDGDETATAKVPFTITGAVSSRSQLVVTTAPLGEGRAATLTLDLAPGQTRGVIPVDFQRNDTPDIDTGQAFYLTAWATRGVMTDAYQGSLTIVDDDPMPDITVTAVQPTVKEGQQARWRVTIASPLTTKLWVTGAFRKGPAEVTPLTGGDVTAAWRHQYLFPGAASKPLYRQYAMIEAAIKPGQTSTTVSVPIRADGQREGREQVTLAISVADQTFVRTVYVAASKKR